MSRERERERGPRDLRDVARLSRAIHREVRSSWVLGKMERQREKPGRLEERVLPQKFDKNRDVGFLPLSPSSTSPAPGAAD